MAREYNDIYEKLSATSVTPDEADGIGSWLVSFGSVAITSVAGGRPAGGGAFRMNIEALDDGQSANATLEFPVVSGVQYTINIWGRVGTQGANGRYTSWTGFSDFVGQWFTDVTGEWGLNTWTLTANITGDALIRAYPDVPGNQVIGDNIDIDDIEILDLSIAPSTTTVEIEWIDSISAAATGNKIYRDDVEIADIANGVQFYSDPDAPAGTESKYEVQAHDGAGDETTQEVLGVNVQFITTA